MPSFADDTAEQRPSSDRRQLRVLNLVTNQQSQFYQNQLDTVAEFGVTTETVAVPGDNKTASVKSPGNSTRSLHHYVRFCAPVLRKSLGEFDIVHANNGLTAPAALLQPRLPVVLSLWGSDLMGKYGWVTRLCVDRVEEVIVMSDEMAATLDRRCHVIPHGVDLDVFEPRAQPDARADLGWDPEVKHVLFPYPTQRPVKDYPRARRVVERADAELTVPVRLHTVQGVDHERMSTYMNAADSLLLTSKREGSPNTVKEALACNLPVVATDVGDVRQQLADVQPSAVGTTDAELVTGLVDVLERGERSNGRERARQLGLDRMGRRIRAVYDDVLEGDS